MIFNTSVKKVRTCSNNDGDTCQKDAGTSWKKLPLSKTGGNLSIKIIVVIVYNSINKREIHESHRM